MIAASNAKRSTSLHRVVQGVEKIDIRARAAGIPGGQEDATVPQYRSAETDPRNVQRRRGPKRTALRVEALA